MVYPGMGLTGQDHNFAPQLWIGARGLESLALLVSPLYLKRDSRDSWTFFLMGAMAVFWGWLVFAHLLPPFFIEGSGLTSAKIICEYVIIAIIAMSGLLIYRRRKELPDGFSSLLLLMIFLNIITEFCFTLYFNMYDLSNMLGHIIKVISYGIMLRIVLIAMINKPFRIMSHNAYSYDHIPLPVMILDSQGIIRSCNKQAHSTCPDSIERDIFQAWQLDDHKNKANNSLHTALTAGRDFTGDFAAQNGTAWFNLLLHPITHDDRCIDGFICVLTDITWRRQAERSLIAAKKQADDISLRLRQKNNDLEKFAEILSHHLKEPIRIQLSYAARLERSIKDLPLSPEVHQALTHILNGANRLHMLMRDVQIYLALSESPAATRPCDVNKALDASIEHMMPLINQTHAIINRSEFPQVMISQASLIDVFNALLDNSLTYCRDGIPPMIQISAETKDQNVQITVEDNGIGIPPQHHERVFNVFERLNPENSKPGTGIGLALVHKIIESAQGRVWIEKTPNPGTRITFTLPLSPAANT